MPFFSKAVSCLACVAVVTGSLAPQPTCSGVGDDCYTSLLQTNLNTEKGISQTSQNAKHAVKAHQPFNSVGAGFMAATVGTPGYRTLGDPVNPNGGTQTCEDQGMVTITDVDECLEAGRALTQNPDVGYVSWQPAGGYTGFGSDRARGCTIHSGQMIHQPTSNWALEFFNDATGACPTNGFVCICKAPPTSTVYRVVGSSTCEGMGMTTITDIDECLTAGAALTGNPSIGYASWQPSGGYTGFGSDRVRGCTIHNGQAQHQPPSNWALEFFNDATGGCGANSFQCICKA